MPGPLAGITVLDLTRLAPGPFCTMILGDMGAEVIRVQEPGPPTGRRAEQAGAAGTQMAGAGGTSAYNALQRNKKSIGINLKDPEAREVFYNLVRKADVLVEELRPGVAKRLGIDYDTLKVKNPRLIYCAVTGYGQTGPYAPLAGHDLNYISQAGALSIIGPKNGLPTIPQNLLADYAGGGMQGALGVLAALFAREKTGRGQFVDAAMMDGVMYLIVQFLSGYFANGEIPVRGAGMLSGAAPHYNVYETKDGKLLSIGSLEPWFYANLCRAVGREDLIPYEFDESKHPELFAHLREVMKSKTRDEWFTFLNQTDQCVGKVLSLDELEHDPQVQARQMVIEVQDPKHGKVKQVGIAPKLSETPGSVRRLAPALGEHTDEILGGVGLAQAEINRLREKGAIR
ncbi:MAG: CoA transferase [Deltaproteobacteria bacterium]|nr:CoA transferase [Deltaproteobacteria bacterium]